MYLPLIAQIQDQHGLVATPQLSNAGLDPNDVRRLVLGGQLVGLRRGVYADGDAWRAADPFRQRPLMQIRAAAMSLTSTSYAFSHDSSSIVLGLGAPDPRSALVHLSRTKVHGDAVRAGVKHHLAPYLPGDVERGRRPTRARPSADRARHGARARTRPRAGCLRRCDAPRRYGARTCWTRLATHDGLAAQPLHAVVHRARRPAGRDLPRVPRARLRPRARHRPSRAPVRPVRRCHDGLRRHGREAALLRG